MVSIDCHSFNSTLYSISKLYEVNEKDLQEFLLSTDIDDYFPKHNPNNTGDEILLNLFEKKFGKAKQTIDKIYWFHLTSSLENTDFKEGLLPLENAIEHVWNNLESILHNTPHLINIKYLRKKGVPSYEFMMKFKAKQNGPLNWTMKNI